MRRRSAGLARLLPKAGVALCASVALGSALQDLEQSRCAHAAAERMAGRGWLPPALVIAEPPVEVAQERPVCDDDEGGEDDEAAEFEEEDAA